MQNTRRLLKFVFTLSLVGYTGSLMYKPALPEVDEVLPAVRESVPLQEAVTASPLTIPIKEYRYTLTPRYRYELWGLVVSLYDAENLLDFTHKNDPGNIKDICVVWGENIENGSYKKVKFSSGEFTCFWRWQETPSPPFQNASGSNNHLIPENAALARSIKNVAIGDQVHLIGYLADYEVRLNGSDALYRRTTSIMRDDAGNGACEVVYVTDIEVLKKASRLPLYAKRLMLWMALGSFAALVWI